ncbi:MAG: glycoside hydrolase family 88 protein [Bryobacterales bacterium]|nr:glycoside hydrolase family 88 protein [Bryobacterales bacterium]
MSPLPLLSRRSFTRRAFPASMLGAATASVLAGQSPNASPCRFVHASIDGAGTPIPVAGFAEHSMEPGKDEGVLLRWPGELRGASGVGFAIGNDYREFGNISVRLAKSGKLLALVTVSMAPRFDPYFVPLSEADGAAASREGLLLRADAGSSRRSILSASVERRREAPAIHPFLLAPGTLPALGEYARRMGSLDVVQDFDWRAGCVTEGLHALGQTNALRRYLRLFLDDSGEAGTEAFRRGVEQTLPAAAIARMMPGHPALETVIRILQSRRSAAGHFQGGTRIVAETNYTVAYPLAVLAMQRGDLQLKEQVLVHLRGARDRLQDRDGNLYLRQDEVSGERTYLGWARGVAWYTLGLAATLDALPTNERPRDLLDELRRSLQWGLPFQRADGLWCAFLPEPEVAPDTSGSAGIGAALRIAQRLGVAEPAWEQAAQRALQGCISRLSAHGFLGGVSQSNKREGGEPFQRSSHRVSMQFAMGLLGVFLAETRKRRPNRTA